MEPRRESPLAAGFFLSTADGPGGHHGRFGKLTMSAIKLYYASNVISRLKGQPRQELAFAVLVDNRVYDKQITVRWRGETGDWQALPAVFAHAGGQNVEVWLAKTQIVASESDALPGNVRFAVEGRVGAERFWDNNYGKDYAIDADAGILVPDPTLPLIVLDYEPRLQTNQKLVTVTAVVNQLPGVERVFVRWSTDNWQTFRETACTRRKTYWDRTCASNARNPNRYGCEIWTGSIRPGSVYRVQYAVGCEIHGRILWDNNFGPNYTAVRDRLKVLTLNLHCYQEANQSRKFRQIARAIRELDIDIVCLQEVGENWNDGRGDWSSNAARIINELLPAPYHLYTDWSHMGFDRYREGIAILSKYPFRKTSAGYVSESQDIYSIHARKAVMGQIDVPHFGRVNVFSVHLSWWTDGFAQQFEQLRRWAEEKHTAQTVATLLCGDFNVAAGSDGYGLFVEAREYDDQYLKVQNRAAFDQVFRQRSTHWRGILTHDGRIDYVWLRKDSPLKAVAARELFTDQDYGRVSDHTGYLVEFELY